MKFEKEKECSSLLTHSDTEQGLSIGDIYWQRAPFDKKRHKNQSTWLVDNREGGGGYRQPEWKQ